MSEDLSPEAVPVEGARKVTPRRQSTVKPGGARRQAAKHQRVQLHLSGETVKRLAVHCGMVGRNQSRQADEILVRWLARFGQGRELFPPLDTGEDRQGEAA